MLYFPKQLALDIPSSRLMNESLRIDHQDTYLGSFFPG
jgi:hypothetical protein